MHIYIYIYVCVCVCVCVRVSRQANKIRKYSNTFYFIYTLYYGKPRDHRRTIDIDVK